LGDGVASGAGRVVADKHACDCRGIMTSPWYRRNLSNPPGAAPPGRHAVQEFITTRQGYRLATSTGGVLTGRGADIFLIDDPVKPGEERSDVQRQGATARFRCCALDTTAADRAAAVAEVPDHVRAPVTEHLGAPRAELPRVGELHHTHWPHGCDVLDRRRGTALPCWAWKVGPRSSQSTARGALLRSLVQSSLSSGTFKHTHRREVDESKPTNAGMRH